MLRYKADIRTLAYMVLTTFLMVFLFTRSGGLDSALEVALYVLQLIMAISVGVMVHNHKHVPIWKGEALNVLTDCWLTVLYGFPVFGWIPTHLQNHHMHTNKEEDYTKTYAYSEKNTLWTLIVYPSYSGGVQQRAIFRYVKDLYSKNKRKFWISSLQIVCFVGVLVLAFVLDWKKALLFVVIPQQIALNSVLFFNYLQHIHADEESEFNHSRNIEGFLNVFLFNNGLHTAHHMKPNVHWSETPKLHAEIRDKIDPRLIERSLLWFLVKQYLIAPFSSKWGTQSMREKRMSMEPRSPS